MTIDLHGAVALVTGGSRGIGRACALTLAEAGADVLISFHRAEAAAAETVAAIARLGRRARTSKVDVASASDVERLFEDLRRSFGTLDVLVNNAGVIADSLVGAMEVAAWDKVLEVNLRGTYLCTRGALPLMIPRHRGKIVNVASVAALRGGRGQGNYAAAKGGILAFTRACAVELAAKGIQVNAVMPGMIATEMSASVRKRAGERLLGAIPAGRYGQPEEVAGAVLFLASSLADYVTGHALAVDGGMAIA